MSQNSTSKVTENAQWHTCAKRKNWRRITFLKHTQLISEPLNTQNWLFSYRSELFVDPLGQGLSQVARFLYGGNRWATPVRHNGGRGFSNGRVPVTSKSSQFKQQTLTPCNRSFGWVPFGRFFQFLHDFIFQTNHSHSITSSIWIHLAPLPPFMLPNSPLLLPLRLELFSFYHGFGGPF